MKSILYVGATLMIGASIYGFVDFKKTNHSKEFTKMYDAKDAPLVTPLKKTEPVINEKIIVGEELRAKKEKVIEETNTLTSVSANESNSEKKFKNPKKKKLNYKLYSRAALEERYIDKEVRTGEMEKVKSKEQ